MKRTWSTLLLNRRGVGSQKRLELWNGGQRTRRAVATRQHVVGTDVTSGNAALQIFERRIHQLAPGHGAHDPAFGCCRCRVGEHLELVAAVRALDCRTSLGNERVVEFVFRAAAAATYVHLVYESAPCGANDNQIS